MKTTGVLRTVDELGRIVIPKSMRQGLEIAERDQLEISMEGSRIILQKYEPACIFCGSDQDIILFGGKRVCRGCVQQMGEISREGK